MKYEKDKPNIICFSYTNLNKKFRYSWCLHFLLTKCLDVERGNFQVVGLILWIVSSLLLLVVIRKLNNEWLLNVSYSLYSLPSFVKILVTENQGKCRNKTSQDGKIHFNNTMNTQNKEALLYIQNVGLSYTNATPSRAGEIGTIKKMDISNYTSNATLRKSKV